MRFVCIFFLAFTVAFYSGCGGSNDEKASSGNNDAKAVHINVNKPDERDVIIERQKKEIGKLKEENRKSTDEIKKLTQDKNDAEIRAEKSDKTLSSIAYIALGIGVLLILTFVFILRQNKKNSVAFTKDDVHCPRCGWEHEPGEKVCKNCGTHF